MATTNTTPSGHWSINQPTTPLQGAVDSFAALLHAAALQFIHLLFGFPQGAGAAWSGGQHVGEDKSVCVLVRLYVYTYTYVYVYIYIHMSIYVYVHYIWAPWYSYCRDAMRKQTIY